MWHALLLLVDSATWAQAPLLYSPSPLCPFCGCHRNDFLLCPAPLVSLSLTKYPHSLDSPPNLNLTVVFSCKGYDLTTMTALSSPGHKVIRSMAEHQLKLAKVNWSFTWSQIKEFGLAGIAQSSMDTEKQHTFRKPKPEEVNQYRRRWSFPQIFLL